MTILQLIIQHHAYCLVPYASLEQAKRERITITPDQFMDDYQTTLPDIKLNHRILHGLQEYRVERTLQRLVRGTGIDIFHTHTRTD